MGKITGMLIKLDNADLLKMLKCRKSLETRIREALRVLHVDILKKQLGLK